MTTSYIELLGDMNGKLKNLNNAQMDMMSGWQALKGGVIKDGALDAKTKELIALALGVAAQCDPCLSYHAQACVKYGATREEVADMLGVCVMMGGGPKLMYAGKALAAYDEFAAKK